MATKPKGHRWKPGESGNRAGRPRGVGKIAQLRESIAANLPEIVAALVARARDGDPQAAKLLIDRVLPPLRAVDSAVTVPLVGETLTEQGAAIYRAVLSGEVTPGQGQVLIAGLSALAAVKMTDELEARVSALESTSDERA